MQEWVQLIAKSRGPQKCNSKIFKAAASLFWLASLDELTTAQTLSCNKVRIARKASNRLAKAQTTRVERKTMILQKVAKRLAVSLGMLRLGALRG